MPLRNFISGLIKTGKNNNGNSSLDDVLPEGCKNNESPVDKLKAYADEMLDKEIQICYLCCGEEMIYGFDGTPKVFLKPRNCINEESFAIGSEKDSNSFWKVYWHKEDSNGKLHAVRLVNDGEGNLLYENPDVPFNLEAAVKGKESQH